MPHGENSLDKVGVTSCTQLQVSDSIPKEQYRLLIEQIRKELIESQKLLSGAINKQGKLLNALDQLLKTE
jgi:hypothetical protein